jgi:hypothetical protein
MKLQNFYLLIGAGRLAKHLNFWLTHCGYSVRQWNRSQGFDELQLALELKPRVLLAISDSALSDFYNENLKDCLLKEDCLPNENFLPVHFSGAFHHPKMISAHPLMTFNQSLYPADFYRGIHWTLCGVSSLSDIFPSLKNSFSVISPQQKPLYHAACVLGGNLPVLLWQEMARIFSELNLSSDLSPKIPASAYLSYLIRVTENFASNPQSALTGPIIRGDLSTIEANLKALENSPWQEVYQAFIKAYQLTAPNHHLTIKNPQSEDLDQFLSRKKAKK